MARQPSLDLPSVPQHLIQRDNNRQPCSLQERDYRFYLVRSYVRHQSGQAAVRRFGLTEHRHCYS